MERKGKIEQMDRSFDVEFWQKLGPGAIFAAAWETEPRFTIDLDLWVEASSENYEP